MTSKASDDDVLFQIYLSDQLLSDQQFENDDKSEDDPKMFCQTARNPIKMPSLVDLNRLNSNEDKKSDIFEYSERIQNRKDEEFELQTNRSGIRSARHQEVISYIQ